MRPRAAGLPARAGRRAAGGGARTARAGDRARHRPGHRRAGGRGPAGGGRRARALAGRAAARAEPAARVVVGAFELHATVETRDEVDDSPRFEPARRHVVTADVGYDAAAYVDVLGTYSNLLALPADARAGLFSDLTALVARHGGRIVKCYGYELRVARRAS